MLDKLKLSAKITLLVGVLGFITAVLGIVAVVNMVSSTTKSRMIADEYTTASDFASSLNSHVGEMRLYARSFSVSNNPEEFKRYREDASKLLNDFVEIEAFLKNAPHIIMMRDSLPKLKENTAKFIALSAQDSALASEMDNAKKQASELGVKLTELSQQIYNMSPAGTPESEAALAVLLNIGGTRRAMLSSWLSADTTGFGLVVEQATSDQSDIRKMLGLRNNSAAVIKLLEEATSLSKEYLTLSENLRAAQIKRSFEILGPRNQIGYWLGNTAVTLSEASNDASTKRAQEVSADLNFSSIIMIVGLIIALVLGFSLSILITNSIVKPITNAINGLSAGADQVTQASGEISSSSQGMASGASEQAASLEEISSSLNQITAMTKQTADNARNAEGLVKDSVDKSKEGREAMNRLQKAVIEIQQSSNDTAKILKDIDEIAFQTNLLALNAAVEAARAGEAGKGFAVVAEEVRNLAQRSAESAKKTAELIEMSQAASSQGVNLAEETAEVIVKIEDSSNKISTIVREITTAAEEQARGVSQVNQAIGNMDQVTQSNASSSEELAASSEELSSQALSMNDLVGDLVGIVGGEEAKEKRARANAQKASRKFTAKKPITKPLQIAHKTTPARKPASSEHLIPFDDDNSFGDY